MKPSPLEAVLRHARSLAAGAAAGLPDAALLERFAAGRDGDAFAELVRRHGPMVWAVCRHALANDADAEDAFQAVFLALVRSAARVRAAVGGWLHGVAVRTALKLKRGAARARRREARAARPEAGLPVADAAWARWLAAVHEEVARLPAPLQAAFVLCELEGLRPPEAAARLGWKPGTLSGRLSKARQRLLARLGRRDVAPAAAGAALAVAATAAGAAPPARLVDVVIGYAGGQAAPPAVAQLVVEVLAMNWTRTHWLAGVVLVALGLGAGFGTRWLGQAEAQQFNPLQPNPQGQQPFQPFPGGLGSVGGQNPFGAGSNAAPAATLITAGDYKLLPLPPERPSLSLASFTRALESATQDGWEYCGSQQLALTDAEAARLRESGQPTAQGEDRSAVAHVYVVMVFKRTRRGGAATGVSSASAPKAAEGAKAAQAGPDPRPKPASPGVGTTASANRAADGVIHRLKHADAARLAEVLTRVLGPLGATVVADPQSSAVVVSGPDQVRQAAAALIAEMDKGTASGR